ncbi:MAG TPA: 4-(cytidine 5'-diphospho)-2-C-methyl-D-erythritol kinase [Acidimicrobiales bacterium]|nr:4-(cytidine 5'-diphospho)-2-C-methyl-D-erythritol kinase [Acidimicrobiales bacterium]
METIEFAHAKLTRTLKVTGVRSDGFHLIDAEMVTVDLADRLEFASGSGLKVHDRVRWSDCARSEGLGFVVPRDGSNLVARALAMIAIESAVTLEKSIPSGAGLGGGSADAAAVLRHFGFDNLERAAKLGADVPFCISGGRARVTGIGEIVESLPYVEQSFVIVTPPFGIETSKVYRTYDMLGKREEISGKNDLERAAFRVEPRLNYWRDQLADVTGREPVLAGSGSSLFVECAHDERIELAQRVLERVRRSNDRALVVPAMTVRSADERA